MRSFYFCWYYCAFKRGKTTALLPVWNNSLPLCWDVRSLWLSVKLWKQKPRESPWKRTACWPWPMDSQEFLPNFHLSCTAVLLHAKELPGGKISIGQWIRVSKWDPENLPLTCTSTSEKRHVQNPAVPLSTNRTCYTKCLIWLSVS